MIYSCLASSSPESAMALGDNRDVGKGPGRGGENPAGSPDPDWGLVTLGQVAEGVVHDFNNILAAIAGFAELILHRAGDPLQAGEAAPGKSPDSPSREQHAEFARLILEAAASGRDTVKELRLLTRRGQREKEALDLHELLSRSLSMVRAALGGRISVSCEFAPGTARIPGIRPLLQNLFINLFLNAREAMREGGRLSIRTSYQEASVEPERESPPAWVVSVRDSGAGMNPEVMERLFERYHTTKGARGNGLGLANVLETVKLHQGWIAVDSRPGEGTEFRIHFPAWTLGEEPPEQGW